MKYEVPFEVAKMLGLKRTNAMGHVRRGEGLKYGIVPDDFRCDADSGQKIDYAMRK